MPARISLELLRNQYPGDIHRRAGRMLSATSYFDCLRDVKIPGELGTREIDYPVSCMHSCTLCTLSNRSS